MTSQFNNAMAIFKLLPKTNCKKCNEPTCLAFASKVFLGQKKILLCPYIDQSLVDRCQDQVSNKTAAEKEQEKLLAGLKEQIKKCDLQTAAERTGGVFKDSKLTLRIFGKPLTVDQEGQLLSDIHINPWITSTVLGYILHCQGVPMSGRWVPFRELSGGREKNGLFVQRSEKSFKRIADQYTGLFEDLILIFNGKKTSSMFNSDISLVLSPLPRLPVLVCYWKADEGMASDLHLFFDASADQNAGIDIVYSIIAGIVMMFEKLSLRHGPDKTH